MTGNIAYLVVDVLLLYRCQVFEMRTKLINNRQIVAEEVTWHHTTQQHHDDVSYTYHVPT